MATANGRPDEDRVAIVTGGSSGVGRVTSLRLAALGYAVAVNYLDDQRAAESTVEAALEGRGAAVAIRADVTDELDVERLFVQTVETFGSIDAVVHAAGGRVIAGSIAEATVDELDEMYGTNVRGAFIVNHAAALHVRPGGAVVNLVSAVARTSAAAYGAYGTTSAAVDALTRLLALEVRGREISVNAVSLDAANPRAPDAVADVIAYLLSQPGHAITGHVIEL